VGRDHCPIAAHSDVRDKLSSAPVAEVAIELAGLRKTFGDRVVLDGIDLTVERGTILGRNRTGLPLEITPA
jgi:hypothetical protein